MHKSKLPLTFDEAFKDLMKYYFSPFAKVITDYEIIKLPKKVDLLIIEIDKPIENYVKIFKYFKRFNIIEFKSERNRFRLTSDLYKLGIYIGGLLLEEKEANVENTTFSLVSTFTPKVFLKKYKAKQICTGLYCIDYISVIPIHIVVIEEIEVNLDLELKVIKEFTSFRDREKFIEEILHSALENPKIYKKYLDNIIVLYQKELQKILKKERISMTIGEKNIRAWAEDLGLKDEYISQGINQGIIQGITQGINQGINQGITQGINQGITQGINQGIIQGITQGIEQTNYEIIKKALKRGNSIEEISDFLELPVDYIQNLLNRKN
jgi:hypothetical protein